MMVMAQQAGEDELLLRLGGAGVSVGVVGGKGAWLDRLIGAGFSVPATSVLTTACYRSVVEDPSLARLLAEVAAAAPPPAELHAAARERLEDAFCAVRLPAAVRDALAMATEVGQGGAVAVRSSATAEDDVSTSFAGQYRSVLGVEDAAALETAARLVWASLWYPAPRAYRRFHGVDEARLAMAVVVMRQVPASEAGVAFTLDPGGTPDTVRVEVVEGLGEELVSGRATPTVHLVPRDGVDVMSGRVGEVARLAMSVERSLGGAQDLEWARDADGLWLLQARPITTVTQAPADDGFDTEGIESGRWTTAGIVEMLPGVLPPLRQWLCRILLEEAIRHHEARLENLPAIADTRPMLGRVRGRVVLDEDLVEQMADSAAARLGRVAGGLRTVRVLRARRAALWEAGTVTVAAGEAARLLPPLAALATTQLMALRWRLVDLGFRAMAAEVGVATAAVSSVARLREMLERHLENADAAAWTERVTTRARGTAGGWPAEELTGVLGAAPLAVVNSFTDAPTWETGRAAAAAVPGGAEFVEALESVLLRAGSAAVFGGPTWMEEPALWWPALRAAAGPSAAEPSTTDGADALDELLDGLAANPAWRQARLRTAQIVDLRRLLIRRHAEEASDLLERRERTKAALLGIGGLVRRIHLELGRRLTAAGVLEQPEDIELLAEDELRIATATMDSDPDSGVGSATGGQTRQVPSPAELARRRRWLERCEQAGPLPERFQGLPAAGPPPAAGEELRGWGAGPGRHRGRVRVLHRAEDGAHLHRGDVIVARNTDASWAPLFMIAGAMVVEDGGPLSHAAIVARELGVPAVLNVPGVVARLEQEHGDVTVDGDAGIVTVHHSVGSGSRRG
jgi:rifampicin phosphotransferase